MYCVHNEWQLLHSVIECVPLRQLSSIGTHSEVQFAGISVHGADEGGGDNEGGSVGGDGGGGDNECGSVGGDGGGGGGGGVSGGEEGEDDNEGGSVGGDGGGGGKNGGWGFVQQPEHFSRQSLGGANGTVCDIGQPVASKFIHGIINPFINVQLLEQLAGMQ